MKKKVLTAGLVLLLALSLAGAAFAHGHGGGVRLRDASCTGSWTGQSAACSAVRGSACADEDGDGLCDLCGRAAPCLTGQCTGYVDADGDGVCDNAGSCARQSWPGGGHHRCR